tara:strand:- start:3994 stop:4386 length:393 start_codon:yes stop_codon:yes gene_type:complete
MKSSISKKQLHVFGFLIGFGFPILVGWIFPAISGHMFRTWTLWIGIPSLMIGILNPKLLYYPYKAWIKLGHAFGWVNSRILLVLIFLLVLQPIALIMKLFSYDPLRKNKSNEISYREKRKDQNIDLTRIF